MIKTSPSNRFPCVWSSPPACLSLWLQNCSVVPSFTQRNVPRISDAALCSSYYTKYWIFNESLWPAIFRQRLYQCKPVEQKFCKVTVWPCKSQADHSSTTCLGSTTGNKKSHIGDGPWPLLCLWGTSVLFQAPQVYSKVRLELIATILSELADKLAKGPRPCVTLLSLFATKPVWAALLM